MAFALLDHTIKYGTLLDQHVHYVEVMTEFGVFWSTIRYQDDKVFLAPDINAVMIMEAEKGGTMLDIGANIGRYSVPMAMKADTVLAIEPDPESYDLLRKNVARFPNIEPHPFAISNKSGRAELFQCSTRKGNSSLTKGATAIPDSSVLVHTITLDQFCKNIQKITAIKIDVEGAEVEVFEGSQETLRKHKPLIALETHRGIDELRLKFLIKELGYRILTPADHEVDSITQDKQYLLRPNALKACMK